MPIHLHRQATTTTPRGRAAIRERDEVGTTLAAHFGMAQNRKQSGGPFSRRMPQTICKWRRRDRVADRSPAPHRPQAMLTPAHEAVALRQAVPVSLDALLAVVREFANPHVLRPGLDRCLRRHGMGNLRESQARAARSGRSGFLPAGM